MEILLNDILNLSEEEINNSKIELNMTEGKGGELFLDKWLSLSNNDKEQGLNNNISYWSWYSENKRNFRPGNYVFSFVQMTNDTWLFVSAAEIIDTPKNKRAKVEIIKKYQPFFGKLIIKYYKGNTFARYTFNMRKLLSQCFVKEILPAQYNGEQFEGYDRVHLPFKKLKDIFHKNIMPTYYEALKKITGIYCLTDTKTGKLYIGSATGTEGVAQRWGNYLDSKHGDNVKLRALHKEFGDKYFEEYFTFTLIEYFGLSYDVNRIIEREQYWKKCLNTQFPNGYNDN